jgi:hypothetical protein
MILTKKNCVEPQFMHVWHSGESQKFSRGKFARDNFFFVAKVDWHFPMVKSQPT